ncbi:MAG: EamA family transporter [Verrucomicrobia bacterium]|nr:EamA family transporter [Lachnospiraceae bacterium]MBR4248751.1 EamA family transporter [Verrucomicrobiota bacterium]
MKSSRKAPLLIIAGAMMWGTYGSFVTVIGRYGMNETTMIFFRFLATALPVFLYLLIRDREQLRVKQRDWILFAANGLASILFFTSCYTAAIRETKIATAAALLYTSPAMVMLLSAMLFGEKLGIRKVFSILIAIVGCALVSGIGPGENALTAKGLALGLGAALGYSLYSIFSRMIQERGYSPFTNVLYTFSIAAAAYFLLSAANGGLSDIPRLPVASLLSVLCGLVTGLMAYLLYTAGLHDMEPSRAAQLATVEPVFAAILGVLLFDQKLDATEILGIVLVVFAVIFANRAD